MRGILISPDTREIKEIDVGDSLAAFYEVLGCDIVEVVQLGDSPQTGQKQGLWVDEEGMIVPKGFGGFWINRGYIHGRGLILGEKWTMNGLVETDTKMDVEQVKRIVMWGEPK